MTLAAFLLPAGKLSPILSSFSLRERPPFFDLALQKENKSTVVKYFRQLMQDYDLFHTKFVLVLYVKVCRKLLMED